MTPLALALTLVSAAPEPALIVPQVDWLEITSLVDNTYDCFQPDDAVAHRHSLAHVDGFDSISLRSEMGLAFLVRYGVGEATHEIVFDFGLTEEALAGNLDRLGLSLARVEALVLSHAHEDHYAGLAWAVAHTRARGAPIYVGDTDVFLERRFEAPGRSWSMGRLAREPLEAAGATIVLAGTPRVIAGGALLSGRIPQRTPFERVPPFLRMMRGGELAQDPMTHELALGFVVKGKGLVVITSCAHAGVVNSIDALRAASGVTRVHAVLGGMHLTSAPPAQVEATVKALVEVAPDHLAPMHCTGDRAMRLLAAALPAAYIHPGTGTRYHFGSPR